MTNMNLITIISTSDVISELVNIDTEGISLSEPIRVDSPADVLDAPLNPNDVVTGLEIVKVILETSTAVLAFGSILVKVLQEREAKATIKKNPNSKPVTIDIASSIDEVKRILEK